MEKLEAEAPAEGRRGLDGYSRLLKGAKELVARCEAVAEVLVEVEQGVARWGPGNTRIPGTWHGRLHVHYHVRQLMRTSR